MKHYELTQEDKTKIAHFIAQRCVSSANVGSSMYEDATKKYLKGFYYVMDNIDKFVPTN